MRFEGKPPSSTAIIVEGRTLLSADEMYHSSKTEPPSPTSSEWIVLPILFS
jgi:hypothetical protein